MAHLNRSGYSRPFRYLGEPVRDEVLHEGPEARARVVLDDPHDAVQRFDPTEHAAVMRVWAEPGDPLEDMIRALSNASVRPADVLPPLVPFDDRPIADVLDRIRERLDRATMIPSLGLFLDDDLKGGD